MSSVETAQKKTETGTTFEPRIMAFVCKWCTYAGADLAGTSRMTYPSNVRTLMLPCSGRIDVSFVLRAFLQGADGVVVSGCHPGDCHYTEGNYRARRRWTLFRDLLDTLGVDLRRFELAWISAAEGAKWVKTIQSFTDKMRELGPYDAMHNLASDVEPAVAQPIDSGDANVVVRNAKPQANATDAALTMAVADALSSGKVKAVIGWTRNATLGHDRPVWITSADAAGELVSPGSSANLVRLFRNPQLRGITPIGIVARTTEIAAVDVLIQEAQIDPKRVLIFAVGQDGQFTGAMDVEQASATVLGPTIKGLAGDRPLGFSDGVLKALDELMAKTPDQRWQFWAEQSAKCIKCYACRQSCPMCSCEQCFADKNQPQWFPTAANGPGNFAWHVIRAFHLAGRCVGCGACQEACPAQIPLNLLSAAMARSALKHFGHRAGAEPKGVPLQADFRLDDEQQFIL